MIKRTDIQIRDPFILVSKRDSMYYLYGTTDKNCWSEKGTGFESYRSSDLENWEGPFTAFRASENFWADRHFWAPEVYEYNDKYYMFASFKSADKCRGTQILVSDRADGEFVPLTSAPITPADWECLDGTLYIDNTNKPWMIFCREWVQVTDGEMYAMPLSDDLTQSIGEPILLFNASSAKWTRGSIHKGYDGKVYVTDGPFMYKTKNNKLLMIWSSMGEKGYAVGIAESDGDINGKWTNHDVPLFEENGGHGMIFKSFDGKLFISLHSPNKTPNERPCFFELEEKDDNLYIK